MKSKSHIVLKSTAKSRSSRLTSQLLAEQISVFLKAGGEITKIQPGEAGKKAFLAEEET